MAQETENAKFNIDLVANTSGVQEQIKKLQASLGGLKKGLNSAISKRLKNDAEDYLKKIKLTHEEITKLSLKINEPFKKGGVAITDMAKRTEYLAKVLDKVRFSLKDISITAKSIQTLLSG